MITLDAVAAALAGKRFPLENENATQAAIFDVLRAQFGAAVEREAPAPGGRVDFRVDHIGVEVKIKGQRAAIERQVARYLTGPFDGLLLVTSRAIGLPGIISGKPGRVFNMGAAWL